MPGNFADSNVLLYLVSADTRKADIAESLLSGDLIISVQVLNEIANVLRRKHGAPWPAVAEFTGKIRRLMTVRPVLETTHELGLALARRYQLGVYDGMIAAAALEAGCDSLYSEDMHHGQLVEGKLRIVNPFRNEAPGP